MQKIKAIPGAFEMIILFSLVMLGLLTGAFTPTEAGAAGSVFALVLALIRRKLSWKGFVSSIVDTLKVTCMIILIVAGAVILGRFLTISGLPFLVTDYASQLPVQPWVIMAVILVVYGIAGCVMDALGFLLVSIPSIFSLLHEWLRSYLVRCNPQCGHHNGRRYSTCRNLRLCGAGMSGDIPLAKVFRGVIWFLPVYVITLILLIIWPQLALWLPSFIQ